MSGTRQHSLFVYRLASLLAFLFSTLSLKFAPLPFFVESSKSVLILVIETRFSDLFSLLFFVLIHIG